MFLLIHSLTCYNPQVLDKARADLDIYRELLQGHKCVFHDQSVILRSLKPNLVVLMYYWHIFYRISSVDALVAAHILLLIDPPYSDSLLKDLITGSYPSLVSHAREIQNVALGNTSAKLIYAPQSSSTLLALFPSWPKARQHKKNDPTPEDLYFQRMRWGFIGAAVGSLVVYLTLVGSMFKLELKPINPNMEGGTDANDESS